MSEDPTLEDEAPSSPGERPDTMDGHPPHSSGSQPLPKSREDENEQDPRVPDDYRIRQVLQCIEREPSRTVPALARLVNLSSSRLGHLFRVQVGIDLNSFVRNARLQKAAELLQQTKLSIKEITAVVGYRHASSFVRGFEKKFAVAPADYRRKARS